MWVRLPTPNNANKEQPQMKSQTNHNLVIRSSIALAMALAIGLPNLAQAAEPQAKEGKMTMDGKMMERCQQMKEQKEKMMAEMKAQDAELTTQVAAMNSAPDDKKVGLMATIVTHLVEQRAAMDEQMEKMHGEMMKHMMEHMQMGKESMSKCPMMKDMKGMKGMDAKPEGANKETK